MKKQETADSAWEDTEINEDVVEQLGPFLGIGKYLV